MFSVNKSLFKSLKVETTHFPEIKTDYKTKY